MTIDPSSMLARTFLSESAISSLSSRAKSIRMPLPVDSKKKEAHPLARPIHDVRFQYKLWHIPECVKRGCAKFDTPLITTLHPWIQNSFVYLPLPHSSAHKKIFNGVWNPQYIGSPYLNIKSHSLYVILKLVVNCISVVIQVLRVLFAYPFKNFFSGTPFLFLMLLNDAGSCL